MKDAGYTVRLKDRDQLFAREAFAGRVNRDRHLRRMMGVVIDKDILAMLFDRNTPLCSFERSQSRLNLSRRIAFQQTQRDDA